MFMRCTVLQNVPNYRQARARQEEEERQQQLLAEAQAAQELKIRRELERQARVKEEEQQKQQLLEEARARREYQRQQQLQEQAAAQQEQLRQQQAADVKRKRQRDQETRQQQEEAAAAAAHAQAKQAALAAEAEELSQDLEVHCQSDLVADRGAEQGSASQAPSEHGHKERNWKSADHWLPPRGAPKVTVVGDQPRGWPNGAAFPALPPPNIFRGQG
ncbi:hypothetical protein ABBQ38_002889 [Trebouxia sp. C0009 RCD-2024]